MEPQIKVYAGPDELSEAVAEAFVERLRVPPRDGRSTPWFEVALTGGTIARSIHRAISKRAEGVPWGQTRFWWGDERFVQSDSLERNALQAREDLLDALTELGGEWPAFLSENDIMEVPAVDEVRDVQTAAEVYADLLRHEGTGSWELVMLGVGPDGHVASLFPQHPAATVTDAITVAVTDSPKPPPERVSLTFEALARNTRALWFLVSGAEKADAVARALAPEGSVEETPARGLGPLLPEDCEVVWWLDGVAASKLLP